MLHGKTFRVVPDPFQVIVILDLHDLVAFPENLFAVLKLCFVSIGRIKKCLEFPVQKLHAQGAFAGRTEHLDLQPVTADIRRQLLCDQGSYRCRDALRLTAPDKQKVLTSFGKVYRLSPIDPVRVEDDIRLGRLTENPCQPDSFKTSGIDHIAEHIACADTWQLVGVAYQYHTRARDHSLQERVHQENVDHRHLIDDQDICLQRVFLVTHEPAFPGSGAGPSGIARARIRSSLAIQSLPGAFVA